MNNILDIKQADIKQIIAWAFYDFANSSYFVVIFTFVFATYFTSELAVNDIKGTELWGFNFGFSFVHHVGKPFCRSDCELWWLSQLLVVLFYLSWGVIHRLPLFLIVQQRKEEDFTVGTAIKKGMEELLITLRSLPGQRDLVLFLVARILYIDGLNSILALGGIYAAGTFKLSASEIMMFGIILNMTAGFGAALFAWFDDWIGSKKTILIALAGLTVVFCFLLTVTSTILFWIFAPAIGIFVGPVQAASRTFLARLAKPEEITRMFGLYSFSGKATSFLRPLLVGTLTVWADSQRLGMIALIPFFIVGGGLLLLVNDKKE